MSPGVPHMGYTYLNLLDSPELLQILVTLTAVIKPLLSNIRQGYRYFKIRKAFSKFYRRHSALVEIYSVSLKRLLQHGISELEFYGYLVYKFRKNVGKSNFSDLQQLPILLSVLLVVMKSGIGTKGEVGWP